MKTIEIKVRKSWGNLNTVCRVHGQGKQGWKPKYSKIDRQGWKKSLDK